MRASWNSPSQLGTCVHCLVIRTPALAKPTLLASSVESWSILPISSNSKCQIKYLPDHPFTQIHRLIDVLTWVFQMPTYLHNCTQCSMTRIFIPRSFFDTTENKFFFPCFGTQMKGTSHCRERTNTYPWAVTEQARRTQNLRTLKRGNQQAHTSKLFCGAPKLLEFMQKRLQSVKMETMFTGLLELPTHSIWFYQLVILYESIKLWTFDFQSME